MFKNLDQLQEAEKIRKNIERYQKNIECKQKSNQILNWKCQEISEFSQISLNLQLYNKVRSKFYTQ